uniref:Uncharacterized protein n=1 Tax=Anguilla anguilla TaxID=7936 RepID=A0A0E9Y233_ANGAN
MTNFCSCMIWISVYLFFCFQATIQRVILIHLHSIFKNTLYYIMQFVV